MTSTSPGYYGNANPTLLEVVDPSATRICEFGCGAGALARAIRRKLGSVHYTGVELNREQLALASDALDLALVRNLDQVPDWSTDSALAAALPINQFDHVIFGDVLEHLYDPAQVLRQAACRLRAGGSALVCIPNVQHWSVMIQLIRGHWPQQDAGLFDRTHIRWFALHDMVLLLEGAGLKVERVIPRIFSPEKAQALLEALEPAARLLGVSAESMQRGALPLQYVLVGRRAP
ncbi:MAG: class I SAM-dependent methyltransferase [Pseudomonadota bacterium]